MFDVQSLRENVDVEEVLFSLGIDYKDKSRRLWCLCPFHNDGKIGSAYLTANGYFTCHSCGAKADIFEFVMAVKGIEFKDAAIFIAELCGGVERYGLDCNETANKYRGKFRLSEKEMIALAFPKTLNLKPLFLFNPELYSKVILDKANEMIEKYNQLLLTTGKREGKNAWKVYELFGGETTPSLYLSISDEIKRRMLLCEEIKERLAV
jgi:hypothetical protein